ncbi:MAG: hypothetical protein C5B54_06980, partial [Acidobacteria bacterium]
MIKIIPLFGFVAILFSFTLFAQTQNGAIEGTIEDAEGRAVPGVIITASSPSLIGRTTTTYTDRTGYYRFPTLSSGSYSVQAELAGFQTMIRKDVRLFVGTTLTVSFTLEIIKVKEEVEVTEKPPLIDVSTTAVAFTIPPKVVENLPRVERIQDLIALTPGVSDDFGGKPIDNLVAYGAIGEVANSYWIDGVNVSSPRRGDLTMSYSQNWIDQVHVTGIGAPAEYGGFTGVVANFVTRSGGPQFHGLFDTFFQNQNLTWTNVPDPGPKTPFKTYDLNAQLGGPVLRDKLWFFSGLEYPNTQTPTPGTDQLTTDIYRKLITKLTYKWDNNNTLQGFGIWDSHSFERTGSTPTATPEANYAKNENPQWNWNATWISLLSPQTSFEVRLSGFNDHSRDIENNPDLSPHYDSGTGIGSVNSWSRLERKESRLQLNAVLSHHARNFIHGSHDFRFGVEFERSLFFYNYQYNGNYRYTDYFGAPQSRAYGGNYIIEDTNHRVSSYAEDEWSVTDRFKLSLGVRWDDNRGYAVEKGLVFKNDPVAPRIGFIWVLDKENQTVIKAHYG